MEHVSKEVEDIMGYLPTEFNIPFMNGKVHPEDRSWFLAFGKSIMDFFTKIGIENVSKYKVRYDIRLRKLKGDFARILYQGILLYEKSGGFYPGQ